MPGLMRQVRIYGPRWPDKSGLILFKPGAATSDFESDEEICRNLMLFFLEGGASCVLLFGFSLQLSSCLVKAPKITYFLS